MQSPVNTSTTQPMPMCDECPRVSQEPSQLTVMSSTVSSVRLMLFCFAYTSLTCCTALPNTSFWRFSSSPYSSFAFLWKVLGWRPCRFRASQRLLKAVAPRPQTREAKTACLFILQDLSPLPSAAWQARFTRLITSLQSTQNSSHSTASPLLLLDPVLHETQLFLH